MDTIIIGAIGFSIGGALGSLLVRLLGISHNSKLRKFIPALCGVICLSFGLNYKNFTGDQSSHYSNSSMGIKTLLYSKSWNLRNGKDQYEVYIEPPQVPGTKLIRAVAIRTLRVNDADLKSHLKIDDWKEEKINGNNWRIRTGKGALADGTVAYRKSAMLLKPSGNGTTLLFQIVLDSDAKNYDTDVLVLDAMLQSLSLSI